MRARSPTPASLRRRSVRCVREIYGVDLKRVPPKSRPAARHEDSHRLASMEPLTCTRLARTPPSTFLFLPIHLSNSPGLATPFPDAPSRPAKQPPPTEVGDKSPQSEELRRRTIPPCGGAPCPSFICNTLGYCQPCILEFFITSSRTAAAAFLSRRPGYRAASGTGSLERNR